MHSPLTLRDAVSLPIIVHLDGSRELVASSYQSKFIIIYSLFVDLSCNATRPPLPSPHGCHATPPARPKTGPVRACGCAACGGGTATGTGRGAARRPRVRTTYARPTATQVYHARCTKYHGGPNCHAKVYFLDKRGGVISDLMGSPVQCLQRVTARLHLQGSWRTGISLCGAGEHTCSGRRVASFMTTGASPHG